MSYDLQWFEDHQLKYRNFSALFRVEKNNAGDIILYLRNPMGYFVQKIDSDEVQNLVDFLVNVLLRHQNDLPQY